VVLSGCMFSPTDHSKTESTASIHIEGDSPTAGEVQLFARNPISFGLEPIGTSTAEDPISSLGGHRWRTDLSIPSQFWSPQIVGRGDLQHAFGRLEIVA